MLIGGTERVTQGVTWDATFSMYRGINLWPGVVALFFWSMLLVASLPWFRRQMWDAFYFSHVNFQFMGNVFTVLHNRSAVVWIAPAIAVWYIDVALRVLCKTKEAKLHSITMHGDRLAELVISKEEYPSPGYDHHPGSYIWLSLTGKDSNKEEPKSLFPDTVVPGGPPGGIPSWLWFHPITVSSYNPDNKELRLFIKNLSVDQDEWAARICSAGKEIQAGSLSLSDITCYVGGPNGSLMFENIETMDRVVLVSGGIGITPMAALLEHLLRLKRSGGFSGEIIFLWSTRSVDEMKAFRYLFEQCSEETVDIKIFVTGNDTATAKEPVTVDVEDGQAARDRNCDPPGCLPSTPEVPLQEVTSSEKGAAPATGSGAEIVTRNNIDMTTVPNATMQQGRFDLGTAIPAAKAGTKTGFLACGPEAMMIDSESFVAIRESNGEEIYFHRETFDW